MSMPGLRASTSQPLAVADIGGGLIAFTGTGSACHLMGA
jgi:hypothetical protein